MATGQQKCTGDKEVPYVCIWDVDHCMQLQRLDHNRDERSVIALCFSGDTLEGTGGELLLTVGRARGCRGGRGSAKGCGSCSVEDELRWIMADHGGSWWIMAGS